MTLGLPGMDALSLVRLQMDDRLWGIDSDTRRVSVAQLDLALNGIDVVRAGSEVWTPRLRWRTLSLPGSARTPLHIRQSGAVERLVPFLHELAQDWGVPTVVTLEQPFSQNSKSAIQDWSFGALLVALGLEFGIGVDVRTMNPGEWKLPATGEGYGRGIRAATKDAKVRRAMEKARLMDWARTVGYDGESQDEADACGVVVGSAHMLDVRRRGG